MLQKPFLILGLLVPILMHPRMAFTQCTTLSGTISGSNTCNGAPGLLTFHSQSGSGPFTVVYSDGTSNYTETGVMDGEPFKVQVQPTVSTTYTLVSIQAGGGCAATTAAPGITTVINPGHCSLCTGSLGDPIIDVTFGSGNGNSPPLSTVVPGASTNLIYTPTGGVPASPTPLDGTYAICSTVPINSSGNYWYTGGTDHTGDPNGYMLYENPGTSVGEFFRQMMTTLCAGGGTYEFAAWIANSDNIATVPNPVLPDLTFIVQTLDGTVLDTYNSGPVPQLSSWTWNHYGFFFTLPAGITTAIVRILDNNPGGVNVTGNDFAMDDITFRPCGPLMQASLTAGAPSAVCPGAPLSLSGTVNGGFNNPAYLWQMSTDNGKTWNDLPGSNSTLFTATVPSPAISTDLYYRLLGAEAASIQSPTCRVASNNVIVTVNVPVTDFGYTQLPCDPLHIQFTGMAASGNGYTWSVDGTNIPFTGSGPPSLLYSFTDHASHTVALTGSVCPGSTTKVMAFSLTPAAILNNADTGICVGRSVPLRVDTGLTFCWSPIYGLDNPASTNPLATPTLTTKYHYTALVPGANVVMNGDFSMGNTGFSSGYSYSSDGSTGGVYFVGPSPGSWLPGAGSCKDHTTGTGNMLLADGPQPQGTIVWTQTLTIQPNTNYAFSAWLENVSTANPASLQFTIDGQSIGAPLTASAAQCTWAQFYSTWNSDNKTSVTLSIVNASAGLSGSAIALDDIAFSPVVMETDSITIDVETPSVTVTPVTATVCPGVPLVLQATGSFAYQWSPTTALDAPTSADPTANFPAIAFGITTTYIVTGTSQRGCIASATTTISLYPKMLADGPADTTICKGDAAPLYASGGLTYSWSPALLLDNAASATPFATPTTSTLFHVLITDANQCQEQDSVLVEVRPVPTYHAPPDEAVCKGSSIPLNSQNGPGFVYSWSPGSGLSDSTAPYPVADPVDTITYSLHISDSVCSSYDSNFTVKVDVRPSPIVSVSKDNDVDCAVHTAELHVTGGAYYTWSPAGVLSDPHLADPLASINSSTKFIVQAVDTNGCSTTDSLTVYVTPTGANTFLMPNAFTPNGDGHNDLFGVLHWGDVRLQEFAVYDRYGARIFYTTDPSENWDGTFHGKPQPAGTYVYMVSAWTFCGEVTRRGTVILIR